MQIDGRQIWQVAAGNRDRNYPDIPLTWDVIIIGPGEYGPWNSSRLTYLAKTESRKRSTLKRFCEEIKDGDLIVLRGGTTDVYGVGEVVGNNPLWFDDFGDIDGWDLQHVRRVRWFWKYDKIPKAFPTYSLKYGDTVQRTNAKARALLNWIEQLSITESGTQKGLVKLPQSCRDGIKIDTINISKIGEYLFDKGIATNSIEALISQADELVRIAQWYQRTEQTPNEQETKAYLVIPLLRALGWTPQKMALEWNKIDVGLFGLLPRTGENLTACVEVKRMNSSCLTAKSQAQAYIEKHRLQKCKRLIVTDGIRYGVYLRNSEGSFSNEPSAYLNLTRLMDVYPILNCGGSKEAIELMAADWHVEE